MISQNWFRDINKSNLWHQLYIHLLISPYVFVITRFRICSITLFCDITNSCPFSYHSTLTARADLFLEYAILSHAFHVKKRKLRWFGHVSRSSGLAKTILQGTVKGKRKRGRQKKRWEDNIKDWTGMDFASSTRAAENRSRWKCIVANSSVVPRRPSKAMG